MKNNEIGPVEAARALGVTHPAVIGWCDGTRRPNSTNQDRIVTWTGGAVSKDGWKKPSERKAVEPFSRKTEAA